MRNTLILGKLNLFGVNHQEFNLIGLSAIKD